MLEILCSMALLASLDTPMVAYLLSSAVLLF